LKKVSEPSKKQGKTILNFGMIRPYKGVDILVRALPKVLERHPDAHLKIVGEVFYKKKGQDEEAKLRALIESLNLKSTVTLDLRYVPNEEIPGIFLNADVAVFPYREATQSGTVTIAYSYNLPVIVTSVGGLPDAVIDGKSGFIVPPEDADRLADAIINFFDNPIPRDSVLEVAKSLSWDRYVEGVLYK
jgi:glycosyltransferase involved in cell wall biosynthesis